MVAKTKIADKLFWVDLEMTGLDPVRDRILEVAAIITDWEFNELARYESAVKVSNELIKKRMKHSEGFWNSNLVVKKQLLKQNSQTRNTSIKIEAELIGFLADWFKIDEKIILAGNSIHQDRKFIERQWPSLNERLHYRMLDVSAWKVVFEGKFKNKFLKPEMHRAADDIRGSIDELKYYLSKVSR